jgi:hypothetical protein
MQQHPATREQLFLISNVPLLSILNVRGKETELNAFSQWYRKHLKTVVLNLLKLTYVAHLTKIHLLEIQTLTKKSGSQKCKVRFLTKHLLVPVLSIRDVNPGSEIFHPGSRVKKIPDPGSDLLKYF